MLELFQGFNKTLEEFYYIDLFSGKITAYSGKTDGELYAWFLHFFFDTFLNYDITEIKYWYIYSPNLWKYFDKAPPRTFAQK